MPVSFLSVNRFLFVGLLFQRTNAVLAEGRRFGAPRHSVLPGIRRLPRRDYRSIMMQGDLPDIPVPSATLGYRTRRAEHMARKCMVLPYHCLPVTLKLVSRMLLGDGVGGQVEDPCCRTLTDTFSPLAIRPLCRTCCPSSRRAIDQRAL